MFIGLYPKGQFWEIRHISKGVCRICVCVYKCSACQKNRQVIDEHKKAPSCKGSLLAINASIFGNKLKFVKLFCVILKNRIKLFFNISIGTMDNKITGAIAPIVFFVSQSSIDTINCFPFILVSAKIDI